jgi:hypothetical protein
MNCWQSNEKRFRCWRRHSLYCCGCLPNGRREETFAACTRRRNPAMKAWSVIGLLFGTAILATIPISPQVMPRGVELHVDQAQAQIT